jgi:pyruvate carboxylase
MTDELRCKLKESSIKRVKHVNYDSLATVEFLVDLDGTPYLIEVNTRLQAEHGVTECRYGVDLVAEQIAIAFGSTLSLTKTKPNPTSTPCRSESTVKIPGTILNPMPA